MSFQVGAWNKLPHYAVNGKGPQDFYVWINEDGRGEASDWIRGEFNTWHDLKKMSKKNKKQFVAKVKELFDKHRKI